MDMSVIEDRKVRARSWFESLRDDICLAFEQLEDDAPASLYPDATGRFRAHALGPHRPYRQARRRRPDVGDARTALRKVGVHCSTVHGEFSPNSVRRFKARARIRISGRRASR